MTRAKTPAEEAEILRTATREAHEAMKGLRDMIREANRASERLLAVSREVFDERMNATVKQGLAEYHESIGKAITEATDRVYARFDTLADIMLGEAKYQKRKEPTLLEYAEAIRVGRLAQAEEEGR